MESSNNSANSANLANSANSSDLKDMIGNVIKNNDYNKKKIEKFIELCLTLEKIEISIENKSKKNLNELNEINKSIDDNIQTFKKICINTK